jgi:hypothetical protein
MNKKIIIGFTHKTSAILPKFFCPVFRHCAVVIDGTFVQIGTDGIRMFRVRAREIKKLENAGWIFVELAISNEKLEMQKNHFSLLTCVGFAKRALGIRAPFVWTPDQLFAFLVTGNR